MTTKNSTIAISWQALRLLVFLLLCCSTLSIHAIYEIDGIYYDVEADGIYYDVNPATGTASVANKYNNGGYSGSVTIPEEILFNGTAYRVTKIGDYAFRNSGLTEINIPNSVTEIGTYAFYNCRVLEEITIPNSVTEIGNYAFYGCSKLEEVDFPNSVTEIGYRAFQDCIGLKSVTFGNSVTKIDYQAFDYCQNILSITSFNNTPPRIHQDTFDSWTYRTAILHVPEGSKTSYGIDLYWKYFYIQDDAPMGIESVNASGNQEETKIYTLNGVKLNTTDASTLPKGIYIINGKKTIMRNKD